MLVIGLIGGFLLHALVFPDLFSNGIVILPSLQTQSVSPLQTIPQPTHEPLTKTISFTQKGFSRTNIRVESSRYLQIRNDDATGTMDLSSNYPGLSTPRPYSYQEQLRVRMNKAGTFIVEDKADPSHRLVITVK